MSAVLESSTPVTERQGGTLIGMGWAGDVYVEWDAQNHDAMVEEVRKLMDQGYSFWIIKPKKVFGVTRNAKHKPTEENFDKMIADASAISVPDDTFNDILKRKVANLKRRDNHTKDGVAKHEWERRIKSPEEIEGKDLMASKPVVGG